MQHRNWKCEKFGNRDFETGQFRGAGGFWAAFFDMSNKRFATVTCSNCQYTEMYKVPVSGVQKVFDFLGGS